MIVRCKIIVLDDRLSERLGGDDGVYSKINEMC
jgi:hypothetical protein